MSFNIDDSLIHRKIDEYIFLLRKSGLVTDENTLNCYRKKLYGLNLERIYNAPGDAHVTYNKLEYCSENIVKGMNSNGAYFLDEVLFHEFSHILNSFHQAIRGPKSFMIADAIGNKMDSFTTPELLEQSDKLLYNQDPCLGVILLDEFIAQSAAQILIKEKYKLLDAKQKREYTYNNLYKFQEREYTTNISIPPFFMQTSLADYMEFDMPAKWFIRKYKLSTPYDFVKMSLNGDLLRNIINNLDEKTAVSMYKDLCYLGLIKEAVSIKKGFIKSNDPKDPVNDKRNLYLVLQKMTNK